ncbi:hypothetical protein HHI36_010666 [Cryptolaemus montrouzieri]|uniref:Uncharacterized protein n=1 Tax=Cryptolaemus montrouzieri TaxID=559131 RepID=A0ABD2MJB8_9CUCU
MMRKCISSKEHKSSPARKLPLLLEIEVNEMEWTQTYYEKRCLCEVIFLSLSKKKNLVTANFIKYSSFHHPGRKLKQSSSHLFRSRYVIPCHTNIGSKKMEFDNLQNMNEISSENSNFSI